MVSSFFFFSLHRQTEVKITVVISPNTGQSFDVICLKLVTSVTSTGGTWDLLLCF